MKIQTLLSYVTNGPRVIDLPFDCVILSMFATSRMVDQGEFIVATGAGTDNDDSAKDGSVLLYQITFTEQAEKPLHTFGPFQLNLPMVQHSKLFIRGNGGDMVSVVLTVEVNRSF